MPSMNRKDILLAGGSGLLGTVLGVTAVAAAPHAGLTSVPNLGKPLVPPKRGRPRVAIMIGPDTVGIDAFGPLEAFNDATTADNVSLFQTYSVAAAMQPVLVGGFWVMPHYSFENVPQPNVIVIPQQRALKESIAWVKEASVHADVTMSVCTGAFLLARTGLLDGLSATTHHDGYDSFEKKFPKVKLVRGPRYVENLNVASSGGESSGIDLALRVVERYYGAQVAAESAYSMEHVRRARPMSVNDV